MANVNKVPAALMSLQQRTMMLRRWAASIAFCLCGYGVGPGRLPILPFLTTASDEPSHTACIARHVQNRRNSVPRPPLTISLAFIYSAFVLNAGPIRHMSKRSIELESGLFSPLERLIVRHLSCTSLFLLSPCCPRVHRTAATADMT